ncbi:hypothetical protein VCHA50P415_10144 [Vibrio chagasii]|nr:hypothetical protein VCHA50P415_10144 [Vibrio chagasii]CAH7301471.1 hypothetical protein VCHA53O466_30133 [Vibrio chagasii]
MLPLFCFDRKINPGFQLDIDKAKDSSIGSVTTLKKLPNNTIEATLGGSTLNLSANR